MSLYRLLFQSTLSQADFIVLGAAFDSLRGLITSHVKDILFSG